MFRVLQEAALVPPDLAVRLQRMARVRNLLVHMYWKVDSRRVREIITHDLEDLLTKIRSPV